MEEDIEITVNHPEQRSEIAGVNKFFVYTLKGRDGKGQIDIPRRYSDFNLLREVLLKRWPGCYIPSLPEKKTIGSGEHLFVESRRRGLETFLQTLSKNSSIWNSEQMNIFLRNSSGDLQKQISPLIKESTEKLYSRYLTTFGEFDTNEIDSSVPTKISEFSSYIKDSKVFLEQLSNSTEKMQAIFKNNMQKKLAVLEFLLPDYERHCLLYNDEKKKIEALLFINEDFQMKEVLDNYKKSNEYPSVLLVSQEIKREKRQLESLEETIKIMHEFEAHRFKSINKVKDCELKASKINAGKESLFSKITKQSKEAQISENQQEIDKAKEEEKMYTTLTKIISNLIGLREIDLFKQLRQKAYYQMLKNFASYEKEMAKAEGEIWARVAEHERIDAGQAQTLGLKSETKEQIKEQEVRMQETKGQEEPVTTEQIKHEE